MKAAEDPLVTYFRLFNEIGIIAQLSGNRMERVLPEGMSLAQFTVLNHFVRLGGAWAPSRLAAAFQVTKGAMTNTLQRLEAQGYVRIIADETDARAKLVTITDSGKKARERGVLATAEIIRDLAGQIPVEQVRDAIPFLERLRKVLDENR